MGKKYLIDTNIVSKYLDGVLLNKELMNFNLMEMEISMISKIELLSIEKFNPNKKLTISDFFETISVSTINNKIVTLASNLRKKYNIKTPDAYIAAPAISLKSTLITNN